jgi:hypothetical protein
MRKFILMTLLSAGMLLMVNGVNAQDHNYVKVHPAAHVRARPARPSTNHVWVGTEWNWSNGAYVEVPAHWDMPPAGHKAWVAGRWGKNSKGAYWVAGHWG